MGEGGLIVRFMFFFFVFKICYDFCILPGAFAKCFRRQVLYLSCMVYVLAWDIRLRNVFVYLLGVDVEAEFHLDFL